MTEPSDPFAQLLENPDTKSAWLKYQGFEEQSLKKQINTGLEAFIQCLEKEAPETIDRFAEAICAASLGEQVEFLPQSPIANIDGVHVRHPLFKRIVLPFLAKNYAHKKCPYGRWIAGFTQYFYSDRRLFNVLKGAADLADLAHFDPQYFLRANLTENPGDQAAADMLIHDLRQQLDYIFHEMPSAVLADTSETWPVLDEFERLVAQYGDPDEWRDWLQKRRTFCVAWEDYEADPDPYENFKDYLIRHNIDFER